MKNLIKSLNLCLIGGAMLATVACGGKDGGSGNSTATDSIKTDSVATMPPVPTQNQLSAEEAQNGWKLLFDGKTLEGWRSFQNDSLKAWAVEDECIARVAEGNDIMTKDEYENFELKLEWKISPEGNSGVFYHVVEGDHKTTYETAPEMQIIDAAIGRYATDGSSPVTDKQKSGANYDLHPVDKDYTKPVGEFNEAHIICNNGKVQYFLNGNKTSDFEMWTPEWKKIVKGSKFDKMKGFGEAKKGYIAMQNHGDKVWFRNIRVKAL
jgi:hypothetical protein